MVLRGWNKVIHLLCEQSWCQPKLCVVGPGDDFFFRVKGHDGCHGTEDFLPGDDHVVCDIVHDGGWDVEAIGQGGVIWNHSLTPTQHSGSLAVEKKGE